MKLAKRMEKWGKNLLTQLLRLFIKSFPLKPADIVPGRIKKVLLIRQDRIGDMVLATPAIRALRLAFPQVRLSVLASASNKDVVLKNPDVDRIFVFDQRNFLKRPWKFLTFIRELQKEKPDLTLVLSYAYSFTACLLAYLSGARYRVGYDHKDAELFLNLLAPKSEGPRHEVELNLDLLRFIGVEAKEKNLLLPLAKEEREFGEKFIRTLGLLPTDLIVGLKPGARKESRRWKVEKFAQLAEELIKRHRAKIILTWGPGEEKLVQEMVQMMSERPIVSWRTQNIRELAALIEKCHLFITNVTGTLHVAVAMGVPTIAIVGNDDYRRWGPRGKWDEVIACADPDINSIPLEEVIVRVEKVIQKIKLCHLKSEVPL